MGSWRWLAIVLALLGMTCNVQAANDAPDELAPTVDHHQHLLSPQGAALLNNPRTADDIPAGITQVLQQHEAAWNEPTRLAAIYSADAVVMDDDSEEWLRGRDDAVWYPSMKLFRQGAPGDWRGVIERVKRELHVYAEIELLKRRKEKDSKHG